jgi:hypothetical protein
MVAEHIEKHSLHEVDVRPDHGKRDTPKFHKSKKRLEEDGHQQCYVFGCKNTNIQTHHRYEFSFENICDYDKLKAYLLGHDTYGYSKLMENLPIESVDDVRNLVNYCQEHHTGIDHEDGGSGIGIHEVTEPVPQNGETIEQVMQRVKEHERKAV